MIGGAEEASIEEQADDWLVRWAKWTGHDLAGLGFASEWVTGRLRSGGGTRPPTAMPEEVAVTDKALSILRCNNSLYWHVIELRYKQRVPLEAVGRRIRASVHRGRAILGLAMVSVYRIREAL